MPWGQAPEAGGAAPTPSPTGKAGGWGQAPVVAGGVSKAETKDDLKKRKKNALQRLASVSGGVKNDILGAGKSTLVHTLDILGRPGNAVKSAFAEGGIVGPAVNPLGFIKGAARGLSGKEHLSFQEATEKATGGAVKLPTKGALGFGVGLAGDIASDPLTFVSLGTSTAAKAGLKGVTETLGKDVATAVAVKGVKKGLAEKGVSREALKSALETAAKSKVKDPALVARAEKAAARQLKALERGAAGGIKLGGRTLVGGSKLGKVGQAVTEARPAEAALGAISRGPLGKAGRAIHSGFVFKGDVMQGAGKEAGQAFGTAERMAEHQAANATEDAVVQMDAIGRNLDGPSRLAVTDALHDPSLVEGLTPKQKAYFDVVDKERDLQLTEQLRTNVLPEGVRSPKTYFPRVATPEFHSLLQSIPGRGLAARLFNAHNVEELGVDLKQGFRKARTFMPDANVREVNEALVKQFNDAGIRVKPGTKLFHEDPTAAFGLRGQSANRAVARADFVGKLEDVATADGAPLVVRGLHTSPAAEAEIRQEINAARKELLANRLKAAKAAGAAREASGAAGFARGRVRSVGRRGEDIIGEATVNLDTARQTAKAAEAAASQAKAAVESATRRQVAAKAALKESRIAGGDVLRRLSLAERATRGPATADNAAALLAARKEATKASAALATAKATFSKSEARLVEARKGADRAIKREEITAARKISDETLQTQRDRIKDLEESIRKPTDAEIKAGIPKAVRHTYVPTTFNGERIFVHHSVKKSLEAMEELLSSDDAVKALGHTIQKTSQLWKGMATVLPVSGGFFSRNAETNIVAAWLLGLKTPGPYIRASRMQRAAMAGRSVGEIGGKLAGKDRELWDLARKHGVVGGGFNANEIGNTAIEKGLNTAHGALARAKSLGPIRAGRNVNSAIENNARLALFLDQMAKHGDPEVASKAVNEALFDYGAKTPLEKNLSHVMAFYTFMRKNVALQAKQLGKQPGKASAIEHFRQGLIGSAEEELPEGTEVPDYLKQSGGFLLPRGVAKYLAPGSAGPTFLQPDIGFTSAAGSIDPFIKAAQALIPGGEHVDTAKLGRDLLNVPSGLIPAGLQALSERATGKDSFTGAPSSDPLAKLVLEGLVPGVGKTRRAARDFGNKNFANLLAGIKATEVTDPKERAELYRQLERIQEVMAELKRSGKTVPTLADIKKSGGSVGGGWGSAPSK